MNNGAVVVVAFVCSVRLFSIQNPKTTIRNLFTVEYRIGLDEICRAASVIARKPVGVGTE